MGEVVEVPGLTENELRRIAAMERTFEHVEIVPVLGPDEYGIKDWIEFIKAEEGRAISPSTATRQLDKLVEDGTMAKGGGGVLVRGGLNGQVGRSVGSVVPEVYGQ